MRIKGRGAGFRGCLDVLNIAQTRLLSLANTAHESKYLSPCQHRSVSINTSNTAFVIPSRACGSQDVASRGVFARRVSPSTLAAGQPDAADVVFTGEGVGIVGGEARDNATAAFYRGSSVFSSSCLQLCSSGREPSQQTPSQW